MVTIILVLGNSFLHFFILFNKNAKLRYFYTYRKVFIKTLIFLINYEKFN